MKCCKCEERSTKTARQTLALLVGCAYLLCDQRKGLQMLSLFQILMLVLDVVWYIILAHVIMSWLINFQVLNLHQQFVSQIWYGLNRILEPIYGPIRRMLPAMGGLDLAPLVVMLGVFALRIVLINNIALFY